MPSRLELHDLLCEILGTSNAYFQPPSSVTLQYPAIIYSIDLRDTDYANDKPYINRKRYQIIVIDKNPDSILPDKIGGLPTSRFDRHYTNDNLNHDVYNLYY